MNTLLFLHAQTALHPGSGTATGAIDLPVQRERHTSWPLIPGSSIKGVLRDYCRAKIERNDDENLDWADRDPELESVFGPSRLGKTGKGENARGSNASDYAGALAVTDARILFFPVRSLCGLFAYVTCPAALERFDRDAKLSGQATFDIRSLEFKSTQAAAVPTDSPLLIQNAPNGSNMVLEEFDFQATPKELNTDLFDILNIDRLKSHLAIIHDDPFTHFVNHATQVEARVALNYETKTASDGALFYVETLPPETVFYSLLIAEQPRGKSESVNSPQKVQQHLRQQLQSGNGAPTILQIGGEASTGKGLCRAILSNGNTETTSGGES